MEEEDEEEKPHLVDEEEEVENEEEVLGLIHLIKQLFLFRYGECNTTLNLKKILINLHQEEKDQEEELIKDKILKINSFININK